MATPHTNRPSYTALRAITGLPVQEVLLQGEGALARALQARCEAATEVTTLRLAGGFSAATRLLIVCDPGELETFFAGAPPATCVVLDLVGGFAAKRLPRPGMCLRGSAELTGAGTPRITLAPAATTVPEALELIAELLYALGVELEQRPVDGSPP